MIYASVWKRFAAMLIDSLLITVVIGVAALSMMSDPISAIIAIVGCAIIGQWLYFALMESIAGATVGKKLMGLRVVDEEGNNISFLRATGRYFGKSLSGILMIGYIMAFFSERKQALHDMLAGTFVIEGMGMPAAPDLDAPLTPESVSLTLGADTDITPVQSTPDPFGLTTGGTSSQTSEDPFGSFGAPQTETPLFSEPKPSPDSPPIQPATPASTPSSKSTGTKPCPSCGTTVGQYQTKCHRCGVKLKKGLL